MLSDLVKLLIWKNLVKSDKIIYNKFSLQKYLLFSKVKNQKLCKDFEKKVKLNFKGNVSFDYLGNILAPKFSIHVALDLADQMQNVPTDLKLSQF